MTDSSLPDGKELTNDEIYARDRVQNIARGAAAVYVFLTRDLPDIERRLARLESLLPPRTEG